MLKIKQAKTNKLVMGMLETWTERYDHAASQLAYQTASYAYDAVSRRLPNTKEFENLKNALRLHRVGGLSTGEEAFAVYADRSALRKVKARNIKPDKNVVYVRPKKGRMVQVPPEIEILARYSPWTMDSLPFFPSKRESTMYIRQVSQNEVDKVREARSRDRQIWEQSLAKVGVRLSKKNRLDIPPRAEVVEDVAFRALRLEFGIGKEPARPAWRPVIHMLAKSGARYMLSRGVFNAILNPAFTGWRKGVARASGSISSSELDTFVKFQKRLGL